MFCPNCGKNNPDGSKFCSECGTVFEAGSETAKQTVDQIIEGITPTNSVEGEKPTVDQIIEEIAPEKPDLTKKTEASEKAAAAEPVPEQPAQTAESAQPVQEQPAAPSIPVQPVAPQMPQQPVAPPMPQQPAQPQMYAQPYPQQPAAPKPPKPPRKPLDAKQKKLLIIGGSCGAVLVAFLIVLFAVIIPHAGLKGKLRYSWTRVDRSSTNVLNLKKKTWIVGSKTYKIKSWKTSGDRVQFIYTSDGLNLETQTFVVAFSPDGKKVYFFDASGYDDGDRPDYVFARGNYVQNNSINDILW